MLLTNSILPMPTILKTKLLEFKNSTFLLDLVGYSTEKRRFDWYEKNKKYVFRMDDEIGSLELNNDVVNSKYLLNKKKWRKNSN